MAAIDEINTVNPSWRIQRKNEENPKHDGKKPPRKKPSRSQKNQKSDDGRPHIDEYA